MLGAVITVIFLSPLRSKRWRNLGVALLVPLSWVPTSMRATTAPSDFTRHVWRVQDGLPEDTVQAVAQDAQGFLWLGTTGGVARFDGSEFTALDLEKRVPLPVNSVFCLLTGRDGSLWMGTEGGGLLRLQNGKLRQYTAANGLLDLFVRALFEDGRGRLWIGTDNGLFLLEPGTDRVRRLDGSAAVAPLAVHAIAEDRQGRMWVGGSRLVAFAANAASAPTEFPLPGIDSQNRVKTILPASDGSIWVGTVGGLERLGDRSFRKVAGVGGTVRTLRQTSDGAIWIGTIGHGLWRYGQQHLEKVDTGAMLPSKSVLSVFEDASGQIWVGTQSGLVRLNKTPVHVLPLAHAADPDFETITSDTDGSVLVVASSVFRIRSGNGGNTAEPLRLPQLGNPPVRDLFRAADGALWVGTDGEGAYRVLGSSIEHYRAPSQLPNNFVRAFLETRKGDLWIGTDEGVAHLSGGRVQQYGMRDGLVYFSTRSLLETADGDVWIGTDQGLSDWRAGSFVANPVTAALRGEKVWSLLEDPAGYLWIGTRDHGLYRARGSELAHFTKAQGLATDSIYGIAESRGRLWFSGPNTLSSASAAELQGGSDRADRVVQVRTYALPFSAGDAQFYGGRQPSVCVDRQGQLWFPSSRGAIYLNPAEREDASPLPKTIFVRSVLVDGQPVDQGAGEVSLAADTRGLVLDYAPLLLSGQSGVRFRYRMEGFDKVWTYAGAVRAVSYTNLPAGRYRFRVQAIAAGQSAAETSLSIVKRPFFWQTWWFVAGVLLLLGCAAWAAYQVRIRQVRNRFNAVLVERGRLAREMHDTVIQGCTSISALLEGIASRQRSADGAGGAAARLRTDADTIDDPRGARCGVEPEAPGGAGAQADGDFGNTGRQRAQRVRRRDYLPVGGRAAAAEPGDCARGGDDGTGSGMQRGAARTPASGCDHSHCGAAARAGAHRRRWQRLYPARGPGPLRHNRYARAGRTAGRLALCAKRAGARHRGGADAGARCAGAHGSRGLAGNGRSG